MSILPQKRFYVYTLAYPDGRVFYIGKGTKTRVSSHEAEARKHEVVNRRKRHVCHCQKCRVIRSIWNRHRDVVRTIKFETDDEQLAYAYEAALIAQHASPNLCNVKFHGPDLSTAAVELRGAFYESEQRKIATGRREAGSGSLYQLGDGRWSAMLSRSVDGKRERKKFEAKTREAAAAKMLRFLENNRTDGWG